MASWFTYFIYTALWTFVRLLPEKSAYGLFEQIANIAYRRNGKRVQRLRSNYEIAISDVSSNDREVLVRKGISSAMRYWCDTFRISDWSTEKIVSSTHAINEHFLFDPIREKRGVIVAVPHAGNW
ncbi:MAG: phosphatidylinositol mannoside acyltransferase, partial [Actinobacteria bacterium]|nr:phosphatidylinositol mannoside acyltransferase [Actinomycetota bacterium]